MYHYDCLSKTKRRWKMTSVDSGVETGNESNDTSITQHDHNPNNPNIIISANMNSNNDSNTLPDTITSANQGDMEKDNNDNRSLRLCNNREKGIETVIEIEDSDNIEQIDNAMVKPLHAVTFTYCKHNTETNLQQTIENAPETSNTLSIYNKKELKVYNNLEQRSIDLSKFGIFVKPAFNHRTYDMMLQSQSSNRFAFYSSFEDNSNMGCTKPLQKAHSFTPKISQNKFKVKNRTRGIWESLHRNVNERKMRIAVATNNVEEVKRLLMEGTPPNNQDSRGRSPLHIASCKGYTEIVQLLLEHKANPNIRDCIGNTPLHLAAVTNRMSVITLLLKAGTDILSSDQNGYNPLQLAQINLRILQGYGTDANKLRSEILDIVTMLLTYLEKQKDMKQQMETLSNICSNLTLSSTSDEIQADVRNLLASIETLNLSS